MAWHKSRTIQAAIITAVAGLLGTILAVFWNDSSSQIQQVHSGSGDNVGRDKNVTIYQQPQLAEPRFSEETSVFTFSMGERGISVGYDRETLESTHMNKAFVFNGYSPVDLYIENGQLYADVSIYGGSGLPPIKIRKNKLSNKPPDWDFNSSNNALEIVDANRNPVYQFFYKTPSHIVMNGIFPYPGGLILANKNGAVQNPILPATFRLKPIFQYPSWKYPGQYAE